MRGFVASMMVAGVLASGGVAGAVEVEAKVESKAKGPIAGAEYDGTGTKLAVDATGHAVTILALPVHAKCKGKAPSNEGDYEPSGLGPFTIDGTGTFSNIAKGKKPLSGQPVIKGKFSGATAAGTIVEPAFKDSKGFDCAKFSGKWSAKQSKGSGSSTTTMVVTDDFRDPQSGFTVFNETPYYAEYLTDGRFRIGTRQAAGVASLRKQPVIGPADIQVTTGSINATAGDGAGLVCMATGPNSYYEGFVSQDGRALLGQLQDGKHVTTAEPKDLPAGLLKTGPGALNTVRLVCAAGSPPSSTDVTLYLNGREVSSTTVAYAATGQVGIAVNSASGATEFTFADFSVKQSASLR